MKAYFLVSYLFALLVFEAMVLPLAAFVDHASLGVPAAAAAGVALIPAVGGVLVGSL